MADPLDTNNWSKLLHAYGAADDVPAKLRALASDDAEARSDALDGLGMSLFHQGGFCEATAHAVPFMIDLVADEAIEDRAHLLGLLIAMAGSCTHTSASSRTDVEFLEATLNALRAKHDVLARLLTDDASDVRAGAAVINAALQPDAALIQQLRLVAEAEQCETTYAAQLLSVGLVGKYNHEAAVAQLRC